MELHNLATVTQFLGYLALLFLQSIAIFLPAGLANMAPPVLTKLTGKGSPICSSRFGPNKTWKGLLASPILAALVVCSIGWACASLGTSNPYGFHTAREGVTPFVVATLFGLGALLGDLFKSAVKRRRNIPSGTSWRPWDRWDMLLTLPFTWGVLKILAVTGTMPDWWARHIDIHHLGMILGMQYFLHWLGCYLGAVCKMKKDTT